MSNNINILTNYKQQPAWAKLKLNKQREDQSVVDPGQDTSGLVARGLQQYHFSFKT